MKKLLLLLLTTTAAFAQKPTREQTVQFIKSYFEEGFSPCMQNENGDFITRRIDRPSVSFDAQSCLLTFEYEFYYKYSNPSANLYDNNISHEKYVADLSKVESVSLTITPFGDCQFVYLELNMAPSHKADYYFYGGFYETTAYPAEPEKKKSASIPIGAYKCNGCDDHEHNKKIIQAFNHLRKLCGAPDPINFDGN